MEWLSQLNYLDIVLLIIVCASVIASVVRGFTRELAGLVALILGVVLGLWFHGSVASAVMEYVSSPEVARMVGFGVIFLAVVAIGGFVGAAASKMLQVTGLSLFDRLAGAAFGLLKGSLFCAVILFALLAFTPGGPPQAVSQSRVAPYVMWSAHVVAALAPAEVKAAVAHNAELIQETWESTAPSFALPTKKADNIESDPTERAQPARPRTKQTPSSKPLPR
jgi:membrane protein required for colicin V production